MKIHKSCTTTKPTLSRAAWEQALREAEAETMSTVTGAALTARELAALWECSTATVARRLARLIAVGMVKATTKRIVDVSGRGLPRPAYELRTKPGLAAAKKAKG